MKSKAPLVMMEQMVMLLVFALAAVLCLQAFTASQEISNGSISRDCAVIEAQNVAETLKGGNAEAYFQEKGARLTDSGGRISYDQDWQPLSGEQSGAAYALQLRYKETESDYFRGADITVYDADKAVLFQISVMWQEQEGKR